MKYKDYLEQRQALMNALQELIDTGASDEEYNAKKAEVEALDQKWEAICQKQADLNALSDNQSTTNIQALKGVEVEDATPAGFADMAPAVVKTSDPAEMLKSDAYVNAWAKQMMGKQLTADEQALITLVNAYTHTTGNTGIVIPETVESDRKSVV